MAFVFLIGELLLSGIPHLSALQLGVITRMHNSLEGQSSGERNGLTPCVRISSLFGRFEPIWRPKIITRRIRPMLKLATTMLKDIMKDEPGQDLVEYALLLVFLALAAIAVLPTLGKAVNNVFSQSASTLTAGS
jgi:Flp pilus assembly pilin Flp